MRSGQMTPEMKAMGFPKGSWPPIASPKILAEANPRAGQTLEIIGERAACPSCKGAMNRVARETGARITYRYPGGPTWKAG